MILWVRDWGWRGLGGSRPGPPGGHFRSCRQLARQPGWLVSDGLTHTSISWCWLQAVSLLRRLDKALLLVGHRAEPPSSERGTCNLCVQWSEPVTRPWQAHVGEGRSASWCEKWHLSLGLRNSKLNLCGSLCGHLGDRGEKVRMDLGNGGQKL